MRIPRPLSLVGTCLFALFSAISARAEAGEEVITSTSVSGSTTTTAVWTATNDTSLPLIFLLEAQPHAAEEGPVAGQLLVVRFGDTNAALEISYAVGGTAENEVDYQPLLGRVVIPAGEQVAPIVVTPIDDSVGEARETVVIELTHPDTTSRSYRIQWPGRGVVGIRDNDGGVNFPPNVTIFNPPSGAVFRGPLDLHLTAAADDQDGLVETVEFFAGDQSLGVVTNAFGPIPVLDPADTDTAVATAVQNTGTEYDPNANGLVAGTSFLPPIMPFSLIWSNAPVGEHVLRAVATDNRGATRTSEPVRIRVEADTALPRVGIVARDSIASEGTANGAVDTATFVVSRTGSTDADLSVEVRFAGTAEAGADYETLTTTVVIPAGARLAEVTVSPIDDTLEEDRETVIAELQPIACIEIVPPPPGCYELAPNTRAVAWIEDNDHVITNRPPVVGIVRPEANSVLVAPQNYLLIAHAHDADGTVERVEFFDGEVSLGFVTNSPILFADAGAATGAANFVLPPWSLNWTNIAVGPHVLRAVATDDDGAIRASEPVEIRVVQTNTLPVVTLHTPDAIAAEPPDPNTLQLTDPNPGRFRIARTGPREEPLTVFFHVAGSAQNGVDYETIAGHVTIPAGAEGESIVIQPQHDLLAEGPESVVLSLHSPIAAPTGAPLPLNYIIGEPARGEVVIRDNDTGAENRPPEVTILRPADGAVLKREPVIPITAHAADADGYIVRVEAFANETKIADMSINYFQAPAPGMRETYSLAWTNAQPGEYRLRVRVSDDDGGSRLSEPVNVKVIEDYERTIVGVVAADAEAREGGTTAATDDLNVGVFKLWRRGNLDSPINVFYSLHGTATENADYHLIGNNTASDPNAAGVIDNTTRSVRFAAGQTELRVAVRPVDDTLVEPTETVILQIEPAATILVFPPPPGAYQIAEDRRATIAIRDNDEQRNTPPHVVIANPLPGTKFTAPATIEIGVQTRDHDGWVSQMEFYAGTNKLGDSVVHFIVPPEPNARQRFSLVWTNVPAGEYSLRAKATDNLGAAAWSEPVAVQVRDESALPVINLYAKDARAGEASGTNGEPNNATFVIQRRGATNNPVIAFLEIGGRAENGVDYEMLPTTVTIPAGVRELPIVVKPIDDNLAEGPEAVVLKLIYPDLRIAVDHEIGLHPRAAAIITDNDRIAPLPGPERPASAETLEGGVVHVVVTGNLAEEVIVEGTDNLLDWFEIARGFMADGQIDFVEATVLERAARFYRVIPVSSGLPVVDAQRVFGN